MIKVGINIITYNNESSLANMVSVFEAQGYEKVRVFNNYHIPITTKMPCAKIFEIGINRSFSKNVNEAIVRSVLEGNDYILITGDDFKIEPGWDKYIEDNPNYLFYGVSGCFVAHKDIVKKIGWYDERFSAIGYEDCDYRIRMISKIDPSLAAPDSHVTPAFGAKHKWLNYFTHLDHGPAIGRAVNYHDPNDYNRKMLVKKWGSITGPYVRQAGYEEIDWYPKENLMG